MITFLDKELERFKNAMDDREKGKVSEEIASLLKKEKIVIYGAGAAGKVLQDVLNRLSVPVAFFVDRKYEDIGELNGISVFPPMHLQSIADENAVIIISIDPKLFLEFQDEINDNIMRFAPEARVIPNGRELVLALRCDMCERRLQRGEAFSIVDCINCGAESRGCSIFDEYLNRISSKSELDKSGLKLKYNKFFGCILGNVCTLKCKLCCEMVPYYTEKGFSDKASIIENCRRIADASGFTMYIELIGGEPFLHPDISAILRGLLELKDVGYIKVFTNGTVVPGEELCMVLKNPRIVVIWSNYVDTVQGTLLDNIRRTREAFETNGIEYIYSTSKTWLDFSSFEYVNKSETDLEHDFDDCFIANCHRLYDGVLYRCPHQYAAMRLGKIQIKETDCVEVSKYPDSEELSEALYAFKELAYVDACRYCVVPYKAQEAPAGEQLKGSGI